MVVDVGIRIETVAVRIIEFFDKDTQDADAFFSIDPCGVRIGIRAEFRAYLVLQIAQTLRIKHGPCKGLANYSPVPNTIIDLVSPVILYTSPSPRDRQKSRMPSSA